MLAFFTSVTSWCLGLLDQTLLVFRFLTGNIFPKFFSSGWGDVEIALRAEQDLRGKLGDSKASEALFDVDIKWGDAMVLDSVTMKEGRFPSPQARNLPEQTRECQIFHVYPNELSVNDAPEVIVVMLPATGEASKKTRLNTARVLAKENGWSSIIVTAPFYGYRKPSGQKGFFISNVNDFILQSQAIMEETAAVVKYFAKQSKTTKICLTGFSWGAAMASGATCISLMLGCDGSRVALVPYVGCPSPAAILQGALSSSIDWNALEATLLRHQEKASAYHRLITLLKDFSISTLIDATLDRLDQLPPDDSAARDGLKVGAIRVVAMNHDNIIPYHASADLINALRRVVSSSRDTKFSVRWLPGGHGVGAVIRNPYQVRAIVEAVKELS